MYTNVAKENHVLFQWHHLGTPVHVDTPDAGYAFHENQQLPEFCGRRSHHSKVYKTSSYPYQDISKILCRFMKNIIL